MAGYNERKLEILEYVSKCEDVTASNVAEDLDLEIHNARTLLRRYNRQGLLTRYKSDDSWGTRKYNITEKGLERIEWIIKSFEEYEIVEYEEGPEDEEDEDDEDEDGDDDEDEDEDDEDEDENGDDDL